MKVLTVVGTRPEIIRLSETIKLLDKHTNHVLVHTGQNYDYELNEVFFENFGLRKPDYFLDADTSSLGAALGSILAKMEQVLLKEQPDAFLVLGDTNSSISAVIAKRMKIPVFHMEAGNRSFDENVPEEINRRVVDHVSDYNLVYTEHARRNLLAEGFHPARVLLTGSPMREVLDRNGEQISASDAVQRNGLITGGYFLVSLHREENVDCPTRLRSAIEALQALRSEYGIPVLVSTHPRTRKRIDALDDRSAMDGIVFHPPFGFHDYIRLQLDARLVLSDSGTISEESSILGFPAVTIRDFIERPEALDAGSIITTGLTPESILRSVSARLSASAKADSRPAEYEVDNTADGIRSRPSRIGRRARRSACGCTLTASEWGSMPVFRRAGSKGSGVGVEISSDVSGGDVIDGQIGSPPLRVLLYADFRSVHALGWRDGLRAAGIEVISVSSEQTNDPEAIPPSGRLTRTRGRFAAAQSNPRTRFGWLRRKVASTQITHSLVQLVRRRARHRDIDQALRRFEPDLLHALRIPYEGVTALAFSDRLPVVVSAWGSDFVPQAASDPLLRRWVKKRLKNAGGLHYDSSPDLGRALAYGLPAGVPTLHAAGNFGVDTQRFFASDAKTRGLVVYPRKISHHTNYQGFVDAAFRLMDTTGGTFVGIGLDTIEPEVKRKYGEFDTRRLRLEPTRSREEFAELLRRAEVVVSPGFSDGMPNSVLEALSCGARLVVSDLPQLRELDDGTGALEFVDAADAEAIALGIQRQLARSNLEVAPALPAPYRRTANVGRVKQFYEAVISEYRRGTAR